MIDSTNELNKSEMNRSLWRCIVEYGVANEPTSAINSDSLV